MVRMRFLRLALFTIVPFIFLASLNAEEVKETVIAAHNFNLRHNNVDMVNRHQGVGEFTVADIQFKKWLNVPEDLAHVDAMIGLTATGEVIHVIQFEGRKVARILSGNKTFKDIAISADGLLFAVDLENNLQIFDNSKWIKSPAFKLFKLGLTLWTTTTAIVTATSFAIYEILSDQPMHHLFLLTSGVSAISSGLSTALMSAIRYGDLNEYTDGFVKTNYEIENGKDSFAAQVQGINSNGGFQKFKHNFGAACASDFLPRPGNGAHTLKRIF